MPSYRYGTACLSCSCATTSLCTITTIAASTRVLIYLFIYLLSTLFCLNGKVEQNITFYTDWLLVLDHYKLSLS